MIFAAYVCLSTLLANGSDKYPNNPGYIHNVASFKGDQLPQTISVTTYLNNATDNAYMLVTEGETLFDYEQKQREKNSGLQEYPFLKNIFGLSLEQWRIKTFENYAKQVPLNIKLIRNKTINKIFSLQRPTSNLIQRLPSTIINIAYTKINPYTYITIIEPKKARLESYQLVPTLHVFTWPRDNNEHRALEIELINQSNKNNIFSAISSNQPLVQGIDTAINEITITINENNSIDLQADIR